MELRHKNNTYRNVISRLATTALFAFSGTSPTLNAAQLELNCQALFSSPNAHLSDARVSALDLVLTTLSSRGSSSSADSQRPSIWLSYPRQEPQTQLLVDRLLQLTTAERIVVKEMLTKNKLRDSRLQFIVLLAIYDKATWDVYFSQFTQRPLFNDSLVNSLIPVLRRMPKDLIDYFYLKIKVLYPSLSKRNYTVFPPRRELRLAPKRAVDAFIQHTMRPDLLIEHDIARGHTPLEAYARYLDFARDSLFIGTGFGGYSSEDVLVVARAVQGVLQRHHHEFAELPVVRITGSFPNARAKIESTDLDSKLSDATIERLFPEIDSAVNAAMQKRNPNSEFRIESMRSTTTSHFAAQINPIHLEISVNTIGIEVFSPFQPLNRDQILMPFNYSRPQVYRLESSQFHPLPKRAAAPRFTSLSEIETAVKNKFKEFKMPSKWQENPYQDPLTESLVQGLLKLSAPDRQEALRMVHLSPPADPALFQTLTLALHDVRAWHDYVQNLIDRPQSNDAVFNALVPSVAQMPATLSQALLQQINSAYGSASKIKWIRTFPFFRKKYLCLAPKRSLDVLATHLLNPQRFIKASVNAGRTPFEALDLYYRKQSEELLKGTGRGNYNANAVFLAAKAIQEVVLQSSEFRSNPKPFEIILAGSFSGGRADLLTADIDNMFSRDKFEPLLGAMSAKVNGALQAQGIKANLEVHRMFSATTLSNAAVISPIFIRVTQDAIELLVAPPLRNLERDDYQLDHNYSLPDRYRLDGAAAVQQLPNSQAG